MEAVQEEPDQETDFAGEDFRKDCFVKGFVVAELDSLSFAVVVEEALLRLGFHQSP